MPDLLSSHAEQLLAYAFERGGESMLVHGEDAAHEAVRAGLIELVTIGVDDPMVVLTPAGLKRCQLAQPAAGSSGQKLLLRHS